MSYSIPRFEGMLFNNETTLRTDFNNGQIKPIINTKYISKPGRARGKAPVLKHTHTLWDWKDPIVPFDVYGKPKPILRTNPRIMQEPYFESAKHRTDPETLAVRKTRPRLVMTPAISMDDIEDEGSRELLLNDSYTSTYRYVIRDLKMNKQVVSPLTGNYSPTIPIYIPPLKPAEVSPEWRMETVTWDRNQLRSFVDADKEFWLSRTPECSACQETAMRERNKKLKSKL